MSTWICTGVLLAVLVGLRLWKKDLGPLLHTLTLFIAFSALNAGLESLSAYSEVAVFSVQIILDTVFVSALLMQVYIGVFGWRLLGIVISIVAILSFAVFGFLYGVLGRAMTPESTLSIVLSGISYVVLFRFLKIVKNPAGDFRFWTVAGVAVYYMIGLIAFYTEWTMLDIPAEELWIIHEIGFVLTTACFLYSAFTWYRKQGAVIPNREWYIAPNWLLKKLAYFMDEEQMQTQWQLP